MDRQKIRCSILLLIWGLVTSSLSDRLDLLPAVDQQQKLSKIEQRDHHQELPIHDATNTWMLSLSLAYVEPCWELSNTINTLTSKH